MIAHVDCTNAQETCSKLEVRREQHFAGLKTRCVAQGRADAF